MWQQARRLVRMLGLRWCGLMVGIALLPLSVTCGQELASQAGTEKEQSADEESIPPARATYLGRRIAQTMSYHAANWLLRSTRQEEERPTKALDALKITEGMTVCDMGCGNGFYTLLMADKVGPKGKVLAVDIQQEMLHLLELRCKEAKVENVEPILGGLIDPHLPEGKVDLLLMVDVYHEFSHPVQMLSAIRNSLSEHGQVALLEYRKEDRRIPIKPLHKMSKRQVLREYRANGFKLVRQYDELPWQHLMFFERDPDWQAKTK